MRKVILFISLSLLFMSCDDEQYEKHKAGTFDKGIVGQWYKKSQFAPTFKVYERVIDIEENQMGSFWRGARNDTDKGVEYYVYPQEVKFELTTKNKLVAYEGGYKKQAAINFGIIDHYNSDSIVFITGNTALESNKQTFTVYYSETFLQSIGYEFDETIIYKDKKD